MLAAVEQELADEPLVVIGVHSPKFPTEADADLVREAVRRHGVTHPVVVDSRHALWSAYGVRAWPTLVVVGADGIIVGAASGEPDREPLLMALRGVLEQQRERLSSRSLPLAPEPAPPGTLAFPGGIAVGDGEVYIADTGHHQVVAVAPDGAQRRRFGTGRPGLVDGTDTARFTHPHGLAVAGGSLVVADTGNHAVRAIDLASGRVSTLAGTGERGRALRGGLPARATALRSPWDVAVHESAPHVAPGERRHPGAVLAAMAGSHQLWAVDWPHPQQVAIASVYAGSGREARVDGDHATAAFAQPSGLAWGRDGALYVADSEISAIRRVAGGRVETVAGGDLFEFGDLDGAGDEVRLQHPVGIAEGPDGTLLIADTLNHKVKALDPLTAAVTTLFGDGTPLDATLPQTQGRAVVPADARRAAVFREPEALAWHDGRVLVVDTGNHRVVAVDPASGVAEEWFGGTSWVTRVTKR